MKNGWKVVLLVIAAIVATVLAGVFAVQGSQNKAFSLEEQVNSAESDIKVQEKRRVDLIYNLADCVKQYDKHEAETLKDIVEKRGTAGDIENASTAITAVSEAYPELKSNENYNTLQLTIVDVEEHLQAARRLYNSNVSNYNQMIKVFPNSIIAGSKGCKEKEFFVAEEAKKEDVKIDLI